MTNRSYRSTLREEQAADTRRRIIDAAAMLFAADGFAKTTIARVAEKAGVAVQTVYATFGRKGGIMRALLARMKDDAGAAEWRARIAAEPDPQRKLRLFAEWNRALFATNHALLAAVLGAGTEPLVVELREQGDASAREWLTSIIGSIAAAGALRAELSTQSAIDRAWLLAGMELYFRATEGCGWTGDAFVDWLSETLTTQLLRG